MKTIKLNNEEYVSKADYNALAKKKVSKTVVDGQEIPFVVEEERERVTKIIREFPFAVSYQQGGAKIVDFDYLKDQVEELVNLLNKHE